MIELYVSVRLFGTVVDHQVVPVVDGMRLGDAPDAVVSFPGADLVVRQRDGTVYVRGRRLDDDDVFSMSLGHVDVTIEVVRHEASPGDLDRVWRRIENAFGGPIPAPDWRLFVATAAIALVGSFWDAMNGFVATNPVASHNLHALLEQLGPSADTQSAGRSARIRAPEQLPDLDDAPATDAEADPSNRPPERDDWPPVVRVRVE